jgi:hypothetical protein
MKKYIMAILIGKRKESAVLVQKVLTFWGCLIKTRLGIHDGILGDCANKGLVILELVGPKKNIDELKRKLNLISGVNAKLIELQLK